MNAVNEILAMYKRGEIEEKETNEHLARLKAGFHLDDYKNILTEEERELGAAGLLNVGVGLPDKVKVDPVKMELEYDPGVNYATCLVAGKVYKVVGTKLMEV